MPYKCLEAKTENRTKTDKSLQNHMIKRDSFAFQKNKAKNKIKIRTLAFFNLFVSTIDFY